MAELADAPDLGSGAERREGSTPSDPTKGTMRDLDEQKLYLECDCSSKDHVVCFHYVDWNRPDRRQSPHDVNLYIDMQMQPQYPFWKRVWTALRYTFKRTPCNFGYWNNTIVNPEQARKMIEITEKYLARVAQLEEAPDSSPGK